MADMISTVASTAITNLGSKALQEVASACRFKSDLDKLTETIKFIKQVLLAHENGQIHDFEILIERLKGAVHDADDLIDKFTTLAEQKKLMVSPSHGRFTKEVRVFFSRDNQIANAFSISSEINRIRKNLDDIVGDRERFALPRREPVQPERETCSYVVVEDVIGRDEDKQKVLDVLFGHHDDPKTPHVVVLPIVGTGGLGKTTLAQLAFNDKDVKIHFDPREWVCVGDKFDVKDIIRSLVGSKTDGSSLEKVHDEFRKKMGGKKYLLVLDDVWEENPNQLSVLRSKLSVGAKGSRVLVTTRSMDTAHRIGTTSPLDLQLLSDEDSWNLFANVAFGAEGHSEQQEDPCLVQMGKEIAKKCKNLPLVIKVIASLLQGKDEKEWRYFKDHDLASIDDAADNILPLLKLSYSRLRPQLKQCFVYCSLFPKDTLIDRVTICHLWMAQGFITSSSQDSKVSLEDDADQCFKKLLNRSLFQDINRNEWGEIQSFKMHDYLHDLAREIAGKAILRVDGGDDQATTLVTADKRHLFIGKAPSTSNLPSYLHVEGNRLRTFLRLPVYFGETPPWKVSNLVSSFGCIRVLCLNYLNIKQLPDSIGRLIHLRYLDLSGNDFQMLPRSFTRLHNMETLNLSRCNNLKKLPWDFNKLVNLQSLDLQHCYRLAYMPPGMGNLTRLQRLTRFVASFGKSNRTGVLSKLHTIAGGFDDLISLRNLRGGLDIEIKRKGNNNRVANIRTKGSCLLNKSNLTKLSIEMWHKRNLSSDESQVQEELLECLQPHSNIRYLSLESYGGRKFPSWMSMNNLCLLLPNLVGIKLSSCERCQHLPILSQLPSLKSLELMYLVDVEYIESTASTSLPFFPSLQSLEIEGLYNVKGWRKPTAIETTEPGGYDQQHGAQPLAPPSFHRLSRLSIKRCPNMTSIPLCPSLKQLELVRFNKKLWVTVMETGEGNSVRYLSNPPSPSSSKTMPTSSTSYPLRQLRQLTVDDTEYLNHLPKLCLHSLTSLNIEWSEEANLFSGRFLQQLTGLEELEFHGCEALGQEEVEEETDETSWRSLGRLRRLEFCVLDNLRTLPKWIEYLTNLQQLRILHCNDLVELPESISQLSSSLQILEIYHCHGLRALPQGIRDLTSLRCLRLVGCVGLVERCRKPNGKDWPKIMHVPEIELRGKFAFVCVEGGVRNVTTVI